jgi:hypothetical protein
MQLLAPRPIAVAGQSLPFTTALATVFRRQHRRGWTSLRHLSAWTLAWAWAWAYLTYTVGMGMGMGDTLPVYCAAAAAARKRWV